MRPPKFILFGEDDIDDQELLEEVFSEIDKSFEFKFINNGKQFVVYLEKLPDDDLPCLIVLDYNMPEFNGVEILKKIGFNKRYNGIPKILWSTSNSALYRKQCLEFGASDYLVKPSNLKSLQETIKYMLSFCQLDARS